MKKIFLACFTSSLLTWALTSSYSQSQNGRAKPGSLHDEFISSSEGIIAVKDTAAALLNEINANAARNFIRDFKNATGVRWFRLNNGFVVYFTSDSIGTRAIFDTRGNYIAIVRQYYEKILPKEIRHLVKSKYYDFSIYHIHEVTINGITAYIVNMEDKTSEDKISWKIIKVADGEIEVMKEYSQKMNQSD